MSKRYYQEDKDRILRLFKQGKMSKPKQVKKARNERAYWLYFSPRTSSMAFIITEDDLQQSDRWLIEYIKSVLNYDFNADILLNEAVI